MKLSFLKRYAKFADLAAVMSDGCRQGWLSPRATSYTVVCERCAELDRRGSTGSTFAGPPRPRLGTVVPPRRRAGAGVRSDISPAAAYRELHPARDSASRRAVGGAHPQDRRPQREPSATITGGASPQRAHRPRPRPRPTARRRRAGRRRCAAEARSRVWCPAPAARGTGEDVARVRGPVLIARRHVDRHSRGSPRRRRLRP